MKEKRCPNGSLYVIYRDGTSLGAHECDCWMQLARARHRRLFRQLGRRRFEQRSDGLDLFGGEFPWAAAFSLANTRCFQTSNGALPNKITFEFDER